jgi:hypothetical protein
MPYHDYYFWHRKTLFGKPNQLTKKLAALTVRPAQAFFHVVFSSQ